jgi:hypothetical protein
MKKVSNAEVANTEVANVENNDVDRNEVLVAGVTVGTVSDALKKVSNEMEEKYDNEYNGSQVVESILRNTASKEEAAAVAFHIGRDIERQNNPLASIFANL